MLALFKNKILRFSHGFITCSAFLNKKDYNINFVLKHNAEQVLEEDPVLLGSVMKNLKQIGYQGKDLNFSNPRFFRKDRLFLEVNPEFEKFAIEKLDLNLLAVDVEETADE